MQFRLHTLMIVSALAAYFAVAALGFYFARPMAEAASDYVMELWARAVYRGVCYATFD